MDNLKINERKDTPYILFNNDTGIFEISGKSLPEDANIFFSPIIAWVTAYVKAPKDITTLNLKFVYINTASSKKILEIVDLFVKNKKPKNELIINWFYKIEDEEQREEGEDYADMVNYPFKLIGYS